jgi:hypothetical protein
MPMAATKISRFFIIFTALLLDKIAGYKAKETRTTTGRLTMPELTDNFLSKGPMKSGNPPTETDQASWIKPTSKETAKAQQPTKRPRFSPSKTFFSTTITITPASMGHLPTRSKRQRKQADGLRTLRFTLTKQDKLFRYQLKSESKK